MNDQERKIDKETAVLVVDNDEHFRTCLCKVLERAGYRAKAVQDVQEAVQELASFGFDIVLADYFLAYSNNKNLIRYIRTKCPQTKILLIAAYTNEHLENQVRQAGAFALICKPIKKNTLLDILQSALRASDPQKIN